MNISVIYEYPVFSGLPIWHSFWYSPFH